MENGDPALIQAPSGTGAELPPQQGEADAAGTRGSVDRRFKWHAAALLVVLIGLVLIVDNGAFAIPDEGLYTAQAENLSNGSWAAVRPSAAVDSHGTWFALSDAAAFGDQAIPYARRPFYPVLLTPWWALGGLGGALALSAIGTWLASVFSALAARLLDARATLPTLWLVGIGSPLMFDGLLAVAHSLTAAASALLVLCLAHLLNSSEHSSQRTSTIWTLLAALSTVAMTLLRSEGIVVVVALAIAIMLSTTLWTRWPIRFNFRAAMIAALIACIGAFAFQMNRVWANAILRSSVGNVSAVDRRSNFLKAAWFDLLRPWYPDNRAASATMVLVVVGTVAGAIVLRLTPRFQLLGLGLVYLAAASSFVRIFESANLVSGFLPAMPWIALGLPFLTKAILQTATTRVLLIATGLSTGAIVLTSYGQGGADQWGGRFYHVLIPLIGPVAVLGLIQIRGSLSPRAWHGLVAAIAVLTLSMATVGVRANHHRRESIQRYSRFLESTGRAYGSDLVVFVSRRGTGESRLFWQDNRADQLVLNGGRVSNLPALVNELPQSARTAIVGTDIYPQVIDAVLKESGSDWVVREPVQGPTGLTGAVVVQRK